MIFTDQSCKKGSYNHTFPCYSQILAIRTTISTKNNKNSKFYGHKDSVLYEAAVLFALTFSLEDSFRKYKIDHRSYSPCLRIEFILCSEYLFPERSAPDLLNSRSTLVPPFHFRIQEAQNSTLSPNSSHPQFPFICITCIVTSQQNHKFILERDHFFIQIIVSIIY